MVTRDEGQQTRGDQHPYPSVISFINNTGVHREIKRKKEKKYEYKQIRDKMDGEFRFFSVLNKEKNEHDFYFPSLCV